LSNYADSEDIRYILKEYDIPEEITSEILSKLHHYLGEFEEQQQQISSFLNKEVIQEVSIP